MNIRKTSPLKRESFQEMKVTVWTHLCLGFAKCLWALRVGSPTSWKKGER